MVGMDPDDYVTEQRVTLDAENAGALFFRDRWRVVVEMIVIRPPHEFYVCSRSNQHVDVTSDRVCLEVHFGRHALGVRQVHGHVAEKGEGDELALHIPAFRSIALVEPPPSKKGSAPMSQRRFVAVVTSLLSLVGGSMEHLFQRR